MPVGCRCTRSYHPQRAGLPHSSDGRSPKSGSGSDYHFRVHPTLLRGPCVRRGRGEGGWRARSCPARSGNATLRPTRGGCTLAPAIAVGGLSAAANRVSCRISRKLLVISEQHLVGASPVVVGSEKRLQGGAEHPWRWGAPALSGPDGVSELYRVRRPTSSESEPSEGPSPTSPAKLERF